MSAENRPEQYYQQFGKEEGRSQQTEQEQRGMQRVHPYEPYHLMDTVNLHELGFSTAVTGELGFQPTAEQAQMVEHVKLAYGVLARPYVLEKREDGTVSRRYQEHIDYQINLDRMHNGNESMVLTEQEQSILVRVARTAGIPVNPEQREYSYADIPRDRLLELQEQQQGIIYQYEPKEK